MKTKRIHFSALILFLLLLLGYFIQPSVANNHENAAYGYAIAKNDDDDSGINFIDIKLIRPLQDGMNATAAVVLQADKVLSEYEK